MFVDEDNCLEGITCVFPQVEEEKWTWVSMWSNYMLSARFYKVPSKIIEEKCSKLGIVGFEKILHYVHICMKIINNLWREIIF